MIFDYENAAPQTKRPIIPIFLKSETSFIIYRALIDSGADYCIFSIDIAQLLDIKLSPKHRVSFKGVGGEAINGFWGKIQLRIGTEVYETQVIFAEISDFGHGILGQRGFFDHFDVKLSYNKELIELEPTKA